MLDMVEYSWDIWNMMDGLIIRIFVGTLAYSYDIQHLGMRHSEYTKELKFVGY